VWVQGTLYYIGVLIPSKEGEGEGIWCHRRQITLATCLACSMSTSAWQRQMVVSVPGLKGSEHIDFSDVCRHYLGHWAEILSIIFSLIALLGGAVVYWVLMSNFLFHSVTFIYGLFLCFSTELHVSHCSCRVGLISFVSKSQWQITNFLTKIFKSLCQISIQITCPYHKSPQPNSKANHS